jgi:hypothetical protein
MKRKERVQPDTRLKMRGFDFVARSSSESWKIVTFYERTRSAALALADTWAKRAGYEIDSEDEAA